jgi:hypothetical protein
MRLVTVRARGRDLAVLRTCFFRMTRRAGCASRRATVLVVALRTFGVARRRRAGFDGVAVLACRCNGASMRLMAVGAGCVSLVHLSVFLRVTGRTSALRARRLMRESAVATAAVLMPCVCGGRCELRLVAMSASGLTGVIDDEIVRRMAFHARRRGVERRFGLSRGVASRTGFRNLVRPPSGVRSVASDARCRATGGLGLRMIWVHARMTACTRELRAPAHVVRVVAARALTMYRRTRFREHMHVLVT